MIKIQLLFPVHQISIFFKDGKWIELFFFVVCIKPENQSNTPYLNIKFIDSNQNITEIDSKLLIGADGIFSNVRKLLKAKHDPEADDSLKYLDCLVILGMAPSESKLCLRNTFQTIEGEHRFFSMPFTVNPNTTFWQFSFPCDQAHAKKLRKDKNLLKETIIQKLENWHAPIPELLKNTPLDMMTGTPVYDRDFSFGGSFLDHVILIGDAAHPMSPFKGQGANQALLDAVELADGISDFLEGKTNAEIFEKFIEKMNKRSQPKMDGSRLRVYQYHDPSRQEELTVSRGLSTNIQDVFRERGVNFQSAINGTIQEEVLAAIASSINLPSGSSELHAKELIDFNKSKD